MGRERNFTKSLPSPKIIEDKVVAGSKVMEGKGKSTYRKEQLQLLHASIDKQFDLQGNISVECQETHDTNGFWKAWSEALEKGYIRCLDDCKEFEKVAIGRGKVTIVSIALKRKQTNKKTEGSITNE